MSPSTINPPRDIVAQLRGIPPLRPLTMGDAYTVAERQATLALRLATITTPHVSLGWIVDLPRTEVQLEPRHAMHGLSGASRNPKPTGRHHDQARHWTTVLPDCPGATQRPASLLPQGRTEHQEGSHQGHLRQTLPRCPRDRHGQRTRTDTRHLQPGRSRATAPYPVPAERHAQRLGRRLLGTGGLQ